MSGFGTLGVAVTDSNEFGYRADFSSSGGVFSGQIDVAESSNIGLQFDLIMHSGLDAVVQVIYRNQDDITLDSVLTMAFVRYSPNPNWSFRGGRIALDLFLLTEFRDIGFAHPWAHVPAEIYGVIPHRNIDGLDATYTRRIGTGTFSGKLFYGQSEASVSGFGLPEAEPVKFSDVVGIALDYKTMGWDISLNHSQVTFDSELITPLVNAIKQLNAQVPGFNHIWPNAESLANGMEINNTKGTYTSVGGQYYLPKMTFITELARISAESLSVPNVVGGYLSGIYHANEHNLFATFAFSRSDQLADDDVDLQLLQQIPSGLEIYHNTQMSLGFYSVNQQTFSLGWRWDFTENMSFKLQWDHTRIGSGGSTLWQPSEMLGNLDRPTGRVNALFSNVSFAF
ncbi:hypothetical protein [Alkalimonas amylolytica]|uniref:Porin n=1 Tax=Alkalimonas amylolytica TaxID=152573 RepID=A0A1H3Z7P8_ALKAM|nr:hypothetical protein [Alkalimonas amylolytica]SEA19789.1 hypothetical protein SAMN04488051_10265 [Alkalimonas amylolytica]